MYVKSVIEFFKNKYIFKLVFDILSLILHNRIYSEIGVKKDIF